MRSILRCARVPLLLLSLAHFVFNAEPAAGQFAEIRELDLRVTDIENELRTAKTDRQNRFQNDSLEEVVDGLKKELAASKQDVARLSGELDALRAEVRALSSKPGETPTLTLRAPFAVIDGAGRELFKVGEGAEGTRVASQLAVTANGRAVFAADAEGITATRSVTVNTATGFSGAALVTSDDGALLNMQARTGAGGVLLGVESGKSGFLDVEGADGTHNVRIRDIDSNMGVYAVSGEEQVQASLGFDAAGKGILRVGARDAARGVIGATSSGVSFALYTGAGTDYRVGMLAAADESFVRLNSQGNAVHLNANGEGGAVHVFNKGGNAAASMISTTSGFGQLSLGNAEGDTVVQAGTTVDGLGVVRAGPRMGGAGSAGLSGMPFAILGKKE